MSSKSVQAWRNRFKEKLVLTMGGSCQCCGYNTCYAALEFHHLDPKEKDFGLGSIRKSPQAWAKVVAELKKCILVCSNCHKELHAGVRKLPNAFVTFQEGLLEDSVKKDRPDLVCPICGKLKRTKREKVCSKECQEKLHAESAKIRHRAPRKQWDCKVDLRKQAIMQSDIDFHKYGWVNQVALLLELPPQKVNLFMKRHMPEFYRACFTRKERREGL